jgi:uncharacterized membrane protein
MSLKASIQQAHTYISVARFEPQQHILMLQIIQSIHVQTKTTTYMQMCSVQFSFAWQETVDELR